ncbi:MAG TPA: protein translocase subunit SecDF [Chitinophagales bacterium]|nr:protein translocase subunit SecDF [Chitinophagales bacterium]HRP38077.1 protein translocase subunit SecDF [Chitinophagales bacterium]
MQLKGVIRFFTIVLSVVCLYQLSFTVAARMVESKAEKFAKAKVGVVPATLSGYERVVVEDSLETEFRKTRKAYLDSIQNETVLNLGIVKYTYKDCADKQINLGLDLKGGMNLVLEISEDDVLKKLAFNSKNPTFNKAIELAVKKQTEKEGDFITLFGEAFNEIDPNAKLAAIFAPLENYHGKINFNSSNDDVLKVLRTDMKAAIGNTFNVLKTRIDQFGVASPNISLQEGAGRIILELPGVDDPSRVRNILSQTAQLEFWDTYENEEVINYLDQANTVLRTHFGVNKEAAAATTDTTVADSAKTETANNDAASILLGDSATTAASTPVADSATKAQADTANKNVNPLFDVLYPSVFQDGQAMRTAEGPVVGRAMGKDTAKVNRLLAMEEVRGLFPRDLRLLWGNKPVSADANVFALFAIKRNPASDEAPLTGDVITDAIQSYDQYGIPEVDITMNSLGASKWEKMTEAAYNGEVNGKPVKKCIAIVLDNRVYSAPRVQAKISGGRSQITGIDNLDEAVDLANVLKSGKLEARTKVVEEQVIGPSLGKEAIQSGLLSLLASFVVVFLFMVAYYSSSGMIANIAMFLNLFLIIGIVASIPGSTFTLPGMAGIVLTLGMAVDANVIINERIREELNRGKGIRLAIEEGYKHSYAAIIDGNLTTMVVGIVLLIFGLGAVKGFAVILVIGLFTSMFTAVFFSRLVYEYIFTKGWHVNFGNKVTMHLFDHFHFDFIHKKKISYAISVVVLTLSLASIVFYGFDLGVDFKGGRSYVVQFDRDVSTVEITDAVEAKVGGVPQVKTYGASNTVDITTAYLIDSKEDNADSLVLAAIYEGVKGIYKTPVDKANFEKTFVKSSVKIGPTIADDIRRGAFWAGLFGILGVFAYIFIRFSKLEFALGATIALMHDPIVVLGIFSACREFMPFSLEINQHIVAAVLTLIGYSVNDTVIVFDRIRENIGLHPTRPLLENSNISINQTLSRTIMTSVTVLLVAIILFIFGGEAIRGFSFALVIGVFMGTYSSIFIATPLMVDIAAWKNKKK